MAMGLSGQVALVTGASGGLGSAVTRSLLDAGARVIGTIRTQAEHQQIDASLSEEAASRIQWLALDVTDQQAVEAALAEPQGTYGRPDILAHTVGGYLGGKEVQGTTLEEWKGQSERLITKTGRNRRRSPRSSVSLSRPRVD